MNKDYLLSRKTKWLVWFTALAVVMACVPALTSAPPAAPTLDAGAINRIIMQTANVASTQTAAALSTSTNPPPTQTPTRLPTGTDTEEPTVTNTVIFVFNTPTPFVIRLATSTFGPTSNKDYACTVLNSPEDGVIYSPRAEFKVRWRLRNVGRKEWDGDNIDFVYDSGDRFHKVSGYDLGKPVKIGDVAEFFVEMEAPKDPGTYTTHWAMQMGTLKFCKVSLTIGVR